ncbi:MAG: hypothetical protein ACK5LC_18300 [Coprobacillaceae bacterium]
MSKKLLIINSLIVLLITMYITNSVLYANETDKDYEYCKYTLVERVEPTATEDGYERFYSEICQKEYTPILFATGRNWGDWIIESFPTCEEDGKRYRQDIRHSHIQQTEILPALGHNYISHITKEATCKEEGIITYTCTHDSNESYIETIPILEHNFSDWIIEKEAQPGVTGLEVRTCSHCGLREERQIEALSITTTTPVTEKEKKAPFFNMIDAVTFGIDICIIGFFMIVLLPYIKLVLKEKRDFQKYKQQVEEINDVFYKLD